MTTESSSNITNDWAAIALREYSEGASDVEVMATLNITRKTFDQYYEDISKFREVVEIGRLKSAAFWRGVARKHLFNKSLNVPVWSFVMKNEYGWAEKSEAKTTEMPAEQKSLEELRSELLAKLPDVVAKLQTGKKMSDFVEIPEPESTDAKR